MPPKTVLVVSDAHLRQSSDDASVTFHRFLGAVPQLGHHLVINGDLFDFWFEYRSVIPRAAFPTLSALLGVRKAGVELTVTGGNHDRWGGDFWSRELGARFFPAPVELELAGFRVFLAHGDGLSETRIASRVMHHVTRMPLTVRLFRWVHPDVGFWLADRLSGSLAEETRDTGALDRAAAAQEQYARALLTRRSDLDLVVLGHTHRARLESAGPRRWFLNPGAWMDSGSYAAIDTSGPELRHFS